MAKGASSAHPFETWAIVRGSRYWCERFKEAFDRAVAEMRSGARYREQNFQAVVYIGLEQFHPSGELAIIGWRNPDGTIHCPALDELREGEYFWVIRARDPMALRLTASWIRTSLKRGLISDRTAAEMFAMRSWFKRYPYRHIWQGEREVRLGYQEEGSGEG
jgi:hypothetical protein